MKVNILVAFIIVTGFVFGASAQTTEPAKKGQVEIGVSIGKQAPEINEKMANGEFLKLSSLRGKLVLIDFWAAWCSPCRKENPYVVATYNTYKDKKFKNGNGFTIFSVSLDQNKDAWQNAIIDDKLSWPNHVSDLMSWNAKYARIYGVNSIPANFLIDGDGIIVGINLRGPALENAIKQLLK